MKLGNYSIEPPRNLNHRVYHLSNSFLLLHCTNIKEETFRSNPTTISIIIIKLLSNQKTGKKNQQGQHFKTSDAMRVNKECGIFLQPCGKSL